MVCHALGRCRICGRKHKLPIYGSQENQHVLIEKMNLELIVLNTVCMNCIEKFERFFEECKSAESTKNFESQVETTKHSETSNDIVSAVKFNEIENCQKIQYHVEFNEKTRRSEINYEKQSISSLEKNFVGNDKTIKCLSEKRKIPLEVNRLTIIEDYAPKKLRIVGATRATRGKIFCDHCSKEFTHRGDLKRHKRKHTGERPYECKDCLTKFSQLSNLTRHRLVHTGERPFVCEQCGQSYSRKGRLANHIDRDLCQRKKQTKKTPIHRFVAKIHEIKE